jgi:hypothetical protein
MESHLRDSTAALHVSGLSLEESFLIATRRMDSSGRLEMEFRKINRQTLWMRKAVAFGVVAIVFSLAGAGITGSIVRRGSPRWAASLLSRPSSQLARTAPDAPRREFKSNRGGELLHTSLVVQDPHTGEIMAMVGGEGVIPAQLWLSLEQSRFPARLWLSLEDYKSLKQAR